ncbi:MAG: hypothetical protein Tsb009_29960 [Planctomycetaceae bacterium]
MPKEKLRLAALICVSTEQQEEKGESLRVQRTDIESTADQIGRRIAEWYGGQEHATPGWERAERKRLLIDAQKSSRPFDAVIVHHADRWSRDIEASATGLRVLKDAGIRYFYVLSDKHDLMNPNDEMRLGFHSLIGQYFARNQKKKSIEARIHRAQRGLPSCGRLPFGRTFDPKTGKWGIDDEKAAMIRDIATRDLSGESMSAMATEYGINHSYLHKTIHHCSGSIWMQTFRVPDLDISADVETEVPPLLEPEVIEALHKKAAANRTFTHGEIKNRHMLSRMLFCAECGYAMTGQTNYNGKHYYRHRRNGGAEHCSMRPRPWIQAEVVERTVIEHLLALFGNPAALVRAIEDATPNNDKLNKLRETEDRVTQQLAKLTGERQRVVRLIRKELISEVEGDTELNDIKKQHEQLSKKLASLQKELAGHLTHKEATRRAKRLSARRTALLELANDPDEISYEDARALLAEVFGGTLPNGQRMGVYVIPIDKGPNIKNRRFRYQLRGHLQDTGEGASCGTSSGSRSPDTGRPARRFRQPVVRRRDESTQSPVARAPPSTVPSRVFS